MRIKINLAILLLFVLFTNINIIFGQGVITATSSSYDWRDDPYENTSYNNTTSYNINNFYVKQDIETGTRDENGYAIDFIFTKTNLDIGEYEIEISDGPNDLFNINGTNIFIEFNDYFGYAGYGTRCILHVNNSQYYSTLTKL